MEFWNKYKGAATILLTLITLGGSILYKVAKMESMAVENTEYRKESEKARKYFEIEFGKMMVMMGQVLDASLKNEKNIKEIKEDFGDYKKGQEEIIRKFLYINKNLKDPRLHTRIDTISIKGIGNIAIQERKPETIKEYVKL